MWLAGGSRRRCGLADGIVSLEKLLVNFHSLALCTAVCMINTSMRMDGRSLFDVCSGLNDRFEC